MKKVLKKIQEKWALYLLEFFVIIISIISAFMLDSWHDKKQEYSKETLTLTDISDALSFDIIDLKINIDGHEAGIRSADIIKDYLNGSTSYNDSLEVHFGNIVQEYYFFNENSAYESYKSSGTELIKNRELRKAIAKLYEFDYRSIQHLEETAGREIFDMNSIQYFSEHFDIKGAHNNLDQLKLSPRNAAQLKLNEEFAFYVNYQQVMRKFIFSRYLDIENKVNEVIAMIEKELETR